ncbi:MAG: MFS transporter [Bacteroidales bacterium]
MNYLQLFRANPRILSFGMMLVFFSSFGQTFVVSLYIPDLMEAFGLSSSGFSTLYAIATLTSAATLIYVGKKIDQVTLKRFALFVITGIILACLVMAASWHLAVLFLGLYTIRFFGQGLMMHTAMTTMSRYFSRARGKALSIAALGFPLGEAIFPVLIASSIGLFGWRETLVLSAVMVGIVLLPFAIVSLNRMKGLRVNEGVPDSTGQSPEETAETARSWRQKEVIRSPWFYILAPTVFLIGFLQTALFFFQTFMADYKGWTTEWMAGSIAAYAVSSIFMSMVSGPLVDKFSARRVFPFILIPLAIGLIVLSTGNHPVFAPIYWLLVGFTGGMNSPVTSSVYAELFGTRSLGAVRSLFTFVMVVSTALGPVVYSFFLERDFGFTQIHYGVMGIILINMLFALIAIRRKRV